LYREDVDDYSVIIKNERFLKSISGIKIEESNKIGEAAKQIKAKINELVKKDINRGVEEIKKYTLK
jgi:hypothetical protein